MFYLGLQIGQIINKVRLCSMFGCSPQGRIRKLNKINVLVLVSDYTRGVITISG